MRRRVLLSLAMWAGLMVTAALILLLTAEVVCPAADSILFVRKACGDEPRERMAVLLGVIAVVSALMVAVRPPPDRA